jgi:hypothetical protein
VQRSEIPLALVNFGSHERGFLASDEQSPLCTPHQQLQRQNQGPCSLTSPSYRQKGTMDLVTFSEIHDKDEQHSEPRRKAPEVADC